MVEKLPDFERWHDHHLDDLRRACRLCCISMAVSRPVRDTKGASRSKRIPTGVVGLLNSHIGLMMIYAGSMCVFAIWNMKGYFDTIPVDIEEASKIDGANNTQMILRIVLPLAKPAITVTCVMVLITVWNEYLFATTFLLDSDSYSLAGGLYQLQSNDYSRSWPMFTAASVLASAPLLLIFFKIQKYMVSGLTAGGVKG